MGIALSLHVRSTGNCIDWYTYVEFSLKTDLRVSKRLFVQVLGML